MLRDQLVCGITNPHMQQQPLVKKDLTFKMALSLLQNLEAAKKNMQTLQGAAAVPLADSSEMPGIHKMETQRQKTVFQVRTERTSSLRVSFQVCYVSWMWEDGPHQSGVLVIIVNKGTEAKVSMGDAAGRSGTRHCRQ